MFKVGDKVISIAHSGVYEIIASQQETKKINNITIPPKDSDYALRRIDGIMESDFEPYVYAKKSTLEKLS